MKLFARPITPFVLNQRFGENKACLPINGGHIINCDGHNPPEGYRSLYGDQGHLGIDLYSTHGQPVYCARDGIVMGIDTNPRSGLDVKVHSHHEGRRYRHTYEHLLGYQPKLGDVLETGSLIGWADNTGYSSGDHLHFQVERWENEQWVAIDPLPLMDDIPAEKVPGLYKQLKELVAKLSDLIAEKMRT